MHAICPTHLILFHLITLTILRGSSLRNLGSLALFMLKRLKRKRISSTIYEYIQCQYTERLCQVVGNPASIREVLDTYLGLEDRYPH
jgi:hypothetical protein